MKLPDPVVRFSGRVEEYARHRPRYPRSLLMLLREEMGLLPEWLVADIGTGTGISAELFLENGNAVVGVEPNAEMRSAAKRLRERWPEYRVVEGRAESTGLARSSVDLVVAGQSFHWFDVDAARAEFARILRAPRRVALLWHTRRMDASPFMRAYEELVLRHSTDYGQVRHDQLSAERFERFYDGPYERRVLRNTHSLGPDALRGLLLSSSYMPGPGHPRHEAMLSDIDPLFAGHAKAGTVQVEYDLDVYWGQLDRS